MPDYIKTCERAARAGGEVLLSWRTRFKAREKAPKDLVTEADLESQQVIQSLLLGEFSEHVFLGEESTPDAQAGADEAEFRWIVDPLDGTVNYVHQLPSFAVSVALERRGELLAGVVCDPVLDECYTASAGQGAFLNGRPISVSRCGRLREALVAASLSAGVERDAPEVQQFIEVIYAAQAVRRLGSAALNLSYVAAGRLDAYWATSVKIWDVAAGVLILREAGGEISGIDGQPFCLERPHFVSAASAPLHAELLQVLRA